MSRLGLAGIVMLAVILALGTWEVKRWVNFTFAYGSGAKQLVCEMVKQEYLSEKGLQICKKRK